MRQEAPGEFVVEGAQFETGALEPAVGGAAARRAGRARRRDPERSDHRAGRRGDAGAAGASRALNEG